MTGARRVWGTIPTCSAGAISATIAKLIPQKLELRVKRKFKKLQNNKPLWWFVIHGTENELAILEKEWGKVHNHTPWTLHECYMLQSASMPNTPQCENPRLSQTEADQNSAEPGVSTVAAPVAAPAATATPLLVLLWMQTTIHLQLIQALILQYLF